MTTRSFWKRKGFEIGKPSQTKQGDRQSLLFGVACCRNARYGFIPCDLARSVPLPYPIYQAGLPLRFLRACGACVRGK